MPVIGALRMPPRAGRLSGERVLPKQERIRIDIFVKDNLP